MEIDGREHVQVDQAARFLMREGLAQPTELVALDDAIMVARKDGSLRTVKAGSFGTRYVATAELTAWARTLPPAGGR